METKIGSDVMLVLQGLDYWAWAEGHRAELTTEFGAALNASIKLDFVVARPASGGLPLGPYTGPQTEVLPWNLRWRFGVVDGWRIGEGPMAVTFGAPARCRRTRRANRVLDRATAVASMPTSASGFPASSRGRR